MAKLAEEPNITAAMKGLGSTPSWIATIIPNGVSKAATALLLTISVKTAARP